VTVETIAWGDTAPMWSCNDAFELRRLGGMKLWTRRLSDLLGDRKLRLEGACAATSFGLLQWPHESSVVLPRGCHHLAVTVFVAIRRSAALWQCMRQMT